MGRGQDSRGDADQLRSMRAAKTAAERKQDERNRMRALGFVLRQAWVHEDDVERFAKYVERLRKRREA